MADCRLFWAQGPVLSDVPVALHEPMSTNNMPSHRFSHAPSRRRHAGSIMPCLQRSRPSDILTFLDMDRDGAISIEEFKAQHRRPPHAQEASTCPKLRVCTQASEVMCIGRVVPGNERLGNLPLCLATSRNVASLNFASQASCPC